MKMRSVLITVSFSKNDVPLFTIVDNSPNAITEFEDLYNLTHDIFYTKPINIGSSTQKVRLIVGETNPLYSDCLLYKAAFINAYEIGVKKRNLLYIHLGNRLKDLIQDIE